MARNNTVLVTGGSGFIAKHIIQQLLDEGFRVRASVRSKARESEIYSAMQEFTKNPENLENRLSFVHLDLNSDDGWDAALSGVMALMHTASPFPMVQPNNEEDIIRPAVDGTLRALKAALVAGVERVILTSSSVAIMNRHLPAGRQRFDENDWSDMHTPMATPYVKSKTMAEKAAWSFARENPEIKLTTINPGLVFGPSMDQHVSTSLQIVARFLRGKDPMVPRVGFPVVDVRDVAQMHVRALLRPESAGARFIGSERFMWMQDVATVLKSEFPDHKVATRVAPDWLIRFIAMFDKSLRGLVPFLGHETPLDNTAACEILGIEFIDARQAVKTAGASVLRDNLTS